MIAKAGVVFASFFLLLATWGGEAAGQNRPGTPGGSTPAGPRLRL